MLITVLSASSGTDCSWGGCVSIDATKALLAFALDASRFPVCVLSEMVRCRLAVLMLLWDSRAGELTIDIGWEVSSFAVGFS
jgi:hypothetical protein